MEDTSLIMFIIYLKIIKKKFQIIFFLGVIKKKILFQFLIFLPTECPAKQTTLTIKNI
jgi:hypothetical protein